MNTSLPVSAPTPDIPAPDALTLEVKGMSCASCVAHIERALKKVPGVVEASVNLALETATVRGNNLQAKTLEAAVEEAGYHASVRTAAKKPVAARGADPEQLQFLLAAAFTLPLVAPMLLQWVGVHLMLNGWLQLALATPVQFWFGRRFLLGSLKALKSGTANMDTLVALGTLAAFSLSLFQLLNGRSGMHDLYFEAATVIITLILLGKWLEARARVQTTAAIRALQALSPEHATVLRNGAEATIAIAGLQVGDVLVIRPGERVAADGIITEGRGQLDEALLTGENAPVLREPGAAVTGGAINLDGLLKVRVTATGTETTLARIVRLVETAQNSKAPIQRLADKVSGVMVPVVIAIAAVTALGWGFIGGDWAAATLNAVSVLVIACPCALGLATPAALMAGTGVAAQSGILIRDADALEQAQALTIVAFDKTGTLTEGRPRLEKIVSLSGDGNGDNNIDNNIDKNIDKNSVLALAAGLQQGSSHPLAQAVLASAKERLLAPVAMHNSRTLAGRGVTAQNDGKDYWFGNRRLLQDLGWSDSELDQHQQAAGAEGYTLAWLARSGNAGNQLLGLVLFRDTLRSTARAAIDQLHQLGIRTLMLSGDNRASAEAIAREIGLDDVRADILPEHKADAIRALQQQGAIVAMVGDGINDAPALAAADVGIAMGGGTDVALQTAGITLMQSDPLRVADAIAISQQTWRKIRQNLFWAFAYNLLGIPLAAAGLLNPMLAGAMMAFSSVSVVSNALLLRYWRPSRLPPAKP